MVGMVVSAEAAPGACWTLSALEVPGSTAWTVAAGTLAPVVRERTSYFDAPVTTYGSVPTVAVAPSLPPSITLSGCHWLQVAPARVRIWNWLDRKSTRLNSSHANIS